MCHQAKEEEKQMKHDRGVLQELKLETQELSGKYQNQQQQQQMLQKQQQCSKSQMLNQHLLQSGHYFCIFIIITIIINI